MYIARIASDYRKQLTTAHLNESSQYAKLLGAKLGVLSLAQLVALLHDMGKFSNAFVEYLERSFKSAICVGELL